MSAADDRESLYVPALRFRWLTPAYDVVVRATTRERAFKVALVDQAKIANGQRVLDLACGTGTLSILIKQRCPQATVTGIDGDPDILLIASRKAAEAAVPIQFDHGLSWQLPYPDAHFNRVVSSLFFHHLSWRDKERTVRELFRVLRPGGELHVADWGCPTGPVMRAAFVTVQLLDGFANTRDNVQGKLMSLFESAGFSEVTQTSTFSTVLGTLALYRAVKPTGAHHD
ncbi:MAG: methyltransferase domain-containing protein [Gammaproteobacteria bacterium]|nr:methyltransferase domain-containing protein [Gammaproteobacteria bacterium]